MLCINGALWISSKSEIEREDWKEGEGGGGGGGGGRGRYGHITESDRKSMMPHN